MNKKINLVLFYCDRMQGFFGIGTHMFELLNYLKLSPDISITIVFTETEKYSECTVVQQDGVEMIYIPCPENGLFLANEHTKINRSLAQRIIQLSYPYLRNKENMVCWFNSLGELQLLHHIRDYYPCKVMYVHHGWLWKDYRNVADDIFANEWKNGNINFSREAFSITLDQLELVNCSDKTITVTHHAQNFFSRHLEVPPDKLITIYNGIKMPELTGIDKEATRRELGIGPHEKIILYSGRVAPNKGVIPLVAAFKKLLAKHPDARLVMAGTGTLGEVIKAAMPYWSKVTLTDYLTRDWVMKWYAIADIGVLPSLMEQCSFTAIEMRSWQVPLIVSGVDGLDEMFDDRVDCLKVPIRYNEKGSRYLDPGDIYLAMDLLLSDKRLALQLAETGYRRAKETFCLEQMGNAYLGLIHEIVEQEEPVEA
ncbi:glycosyltransferase [Chitinophaga sp. 22321]|uniref:Glycosyltransferase n=1 Tax=Chitinophaga hostae TaxID=2831022 RepID=A0ABS5J4U3_9BACT|nr:glycosyltransferase [Chitinophaga hostae]MBS0030248.1 glycosyltransferase [Chitinophaga hostae]